MGHFKTWRMLPAGIRINWRTLLLISVLYAVILTLVRAAIPPPEAVAIPETVRVATGLQFHQDDSWIDPGGDRELQQTLFDHVFEIIADSRRFLLVDMFLFNDWQGPIPEQHRSLSGELTTALIDQKSAYPEMDIVFVSDPINTVYGGLRSVHFEAMAQAGIQVVLTDLDQLQDSNPTWSGLWRVFIKPWGNSEGSALPNPLGDGRVSVRSYLALLNFKANHRKLLVADDGAQGLRAMVSSANPHDGSSAHRNVALSFTGDAALDLLNSERALLSMSGAVDAQALVDTFMESRSASQIALQPLSPQSSVEAEASGTLAILSESRIHKAVIAALADAGKGDAIDLVMFYLSERDIIKALVAARKRGALVRVLLDVNTDAFGRAKNGVPNRPVAAELSKAGVAVRWCATSGEQCHAKWLHVRTAKQHTFILGSANYTRRNLLDLNMETNVRLKLSVEDQTALQMVKFFEDQWLNRDDRTYSLTYDAFADDSSWLMLQYRFMEMTGISTF